MRGGGLRTLCISATVVLAGLLLAGCGDESGDSGSAAVDVVATTQIVADLVQEVGGDRVDVRRLLPAGADPHDYEPRPSDARAIAQADVVFRSGGEIDDWLGDLLESAGGGVRVETLKDAPGHLAKPQPAEERHWWFERPRTEAAIEAIRDAFREEDPGGRAGYETRADAYTTRLRRLDDGTAACIRRVPTRRRKLVTTHDAFGGFAHRYGLVVVGTVVPSGSTDAQPSAGEVAELVRQIRDEKVPAVFPERSLGSKLEKRIADEAGARLGDPLWIDTLGRDESEASSYVEAMASNAAAIVEGLTGGRRSCRPRA